MATQPNGGANYEPPSPPSSSLGTVSGSASSGSSANSAARRQSVIGKIIQQSSIRGSIMARVLTNKVPWPKGKRPPSPEDTAVSKQRQIIGGPRFRVGQKKPYFLNKSLSKLGG